MRKLNNRRNMWWYKGEAKVDGTLVCEAEVSAMLVVRMSETFIHPTAVVEDGAKLGEGVKIGPFCIVGPEVELGEGCELISHVRRHGSHDDRRAHADLSVRIDRPSAAGPEICRASLRRSPSAPIASSAKA